jgi:hypothetical protein
MVTLAGQVAALVGQVAALAVVWLAMAALAVEVMTMAWLWRGARVAVVCSRGGGARDGWMSVSGGVVLYR